MAITGVSHIAIGVSDMEQALGFYRGVLGLEVFVDHIEDVAVQDIPPYQRHAVYLTWPGGKQNKSFLVLDSQDGAGPASPRSLGDRGVHHFAFTVDDLETIHGRAVAAGCPILVDPMDMAADDPLNPTDSTVRTTFFSDPDGNVIQLDQYLRAADQQS